MPARLRPTAPVAADAILVGDPGRALMLAQKLLEQPKMSNHARGLWGYSGLTPAGQELTVQSTGMGGPSATVVLDDLAELGVRRSIRIGTCTSLGRLEPGDIAIATEARSFRGSFVGPDTTTEPQNPKLPDAALTVALQARLEGAQPATVASLDTLQAPERGSFPGSADVADMQTAAVLAAGSRLGIAVAAVLIVTRQGAAELRDEDLEKTAKRVGTATAAALSP